MLEIMFITVVLIGALWAAVCIIEHTHRLRMKEIDKFMKKYEKLYIEAERRRAATEMAAMIRTIEHFRDKQ